ncbi:MAG: hypothetical protein ACMUFK_01055 [Thermoplasmatota archaeon]
MVDEAIKQQKTLDNSPLFIYEIHPVSIIKGLLICIPGAYGDSFQSEEVRSK